MSVDENDKLETKIEAEGSSPGEIGAHNSNLFAGPPAKDVGPEAAKRLLPGSNQAQLDEAISLTSGRPKTAIGRHDIRGSFGAYDIKAMPISQLRPNPRNPRRHSKRQLKRLADAIKRFGFLGVIIIDQYGMILAGHGRWEAAKLLGLDTVPCVVADHLDDAAKRAFILSDNRLAELSDWDPDLLKLELAELEAIDTGFDVELTGFNTIDLDRILGPEPDPRAKSPDRDGFSTDPDDQLPDLQDDRRAVSCAGDLWLLGKHRLLNGDALDAQSYSTLLRGDVVRQVVSDPPYNVKVGKNVSNAKGFREFVQASGEMSSGDFIGFLEIFLTLSAKHCHDGAILHVCMDWRHQAELLKAAGRAGLEFKNLCIWVKPSAGLGSFYRNQHELVLVFKTGKGPHINNFGLGQHGRLRSNTWFYPAVRGKRQGVSSPDGGHTWLTRSPSKRTRYDEELTARMRASFVASDRTYGARRVWRDVLAEGLLCGLHRIERLMWKNAMKARPRRRSLPADKGERVVSAIAPNVLDRQFHAPAPNKRWIADFTYIWTAEGWLYVAAVIDLFSRRVVDWSMSASMTAQLVTDALLMAIWRRGKPDALLHHSDQGSQYSSKQFRKLMEDNGVSCSMSRSGNV